MVITQHNLKVGLNQGQCGGFDKMVHFLESDECNSKIFVLRGYAGTGKTFLSSRIIDYMKTRHKYTNIGIAAPTNKALKVIGDNLDCTKKGMQLKTTYQFLGLTEKIDKQGKRTFERDKKTKYVEIDNVNYLVVDEVSMLTDDIFEKLYRYVGNVKIIFMGDPAQIPPIGKKSSIPFDVTKQSMFVTHSLTEIMRQNYDNPIVEASFKLRSNLSLPIPIVGLSTHLVNGKGIVIIDGNKQRATLKPLLNSYFNTEEFRINSDYAKVIAWRRVTVEYLNNAIRDMIFPEEDYNFDLLDYGKILKGEKLIANGPIFEGTSIAFNTSDEFEVTHVYLDKVKAKAITSTFNLEVYSCTVEGVHPIKGPFKNHINILHEDSVANFTILSEELKKKAIDTQGAYGSWVRYYDLHKYFADVSYNYAITAHKSQGSSYTNVFFIEDDVDLNQNIVERNQIKYTSYTRPTDKLFIFKSV